MMFDIQSGTSLNNDDAIKNNFITDPNRDLRNRGLSEREERFLRFLYKELKTTSLDDKLKSLFDSASIIKESCQKLFPRLKKPYLFIAFVSKSILERIDKDEGNSQELTTKQKNHFAVIKSKISDIQIEEDGGINPKKYTTHVYLKNNCLTDYEIYRLLDGLLKK